MASVLRIAFALVSQVHLWLLLYTVTAMYGYCDIWLLLYKVTAMYGYCYVWLLMASVLRITYALV